MWEQYAENHRGVCFVFDRSEVHERVLARLETINDAFAREVSYSDTPQTGGGAVARSLNATRLQSEGDGNIEVGLRAHLRHNVGELFFRKLEDWKTEEEFRYVLLDENDRDVYVPIAGLRAVIVGEHFPEWQLAGAAGICKEAGVDLLKIIWSAVPGLVTALSSEQEA